MGDWTPMRRVRGGVHDLTEDIRLSPQGRFWLSRRIGDAMRPNLHVLPMLNGDNSKLGVRAVPNRDGRYTLLLTPQSGGSVTFSGLGTLINLGKLPPEVITSLPHVWDDDVLVIDVSGLPDATEGQ